DQSRYRTGQQSDVRPKPARGERGAGYTFVDAFIPSDRSRDMTHATGSSGGGYNPSSSARRCISSTVIGSRTVRTLQVWPNGSRNAPIRTPPQAPPARPRKAAPDAH